MKEIVLLGGAAALLAYLAVHLASDLDSSASAEASASKNTLAERALRTAMTMGSDEFEDEGKSSRVPASSISTPALPSVPEPAYEWSASPEVMAMAAHYGVAPAVLGELLIADTRINLEHFMSFSRSPLVPWELVEPRVGAALIRAIQGPEERSEYLLAEDVLGMTVAAYVESLLGGKTEEVKGRARSALQDLLNGYSGEFYLQRNEVALAIEDKVRRDKYDAFPFVVMKAFHEETETFTASPIWATCILLETWQVSFELLEGEYPAMERARQLWRVAAAEVETKARAELARFL